MVNTLPLVVGKLSGVDETTPSGGWGAPQPPVERLLVSPQPPAPFQPLANAGPVPSTTTKQMTSGASRRNSISPPIGNLTISTLGQGLPTSAGVREPVDAGGNLLTVSAQEGDISRNIRPEFEHVGHLVADKGEDQRAARDTRDATSSCGGLVQRCDVPVPIAMGVDEVGPERPVRHFRELAVIAEDCVSSLVVTGKRAVPGYVRHRI